MISTCSNVIIFNIFQKAQLKKTVYKFDLNTINKWHKRLKHFNLKISKSFVKLF